MVVTPAARAWSCTVSLRIRRQGVRDSAPSTRPTPPPRKPERHDALPAGRSRRVHQLGRSATWPGVWSIVASHRPSKHSTAAAMVDLHYAEPGLAELYDTFCEGRPDFSFYLPLVMSAERVLDVGCGTGKLLRLAREAGHTGRLCGLDPAAAMLQVARQRTDVEWVLNDISQVGWNREFDLAVMTGHAFQVLIEDAEVRSSLTAIRAALAEDGRFVFETRNPLVR